MNSRVHCRPYGPTAWIVEDVDDPAAWANGLRRLAGEGIVDVVPAESTVLVVSEPAAAGRVARLLEQVTPEPPHADHEDELTIDVSYDGVDLESVATATGLGVDEVVERHRAGVYTVAFCGFSPGFAYLTGLDPMLHLPRREVPRTTVPQGSVAIAAGYGAVYPSTSPGGWHLLGSTAVTLWDPDSDPPAVLRPGRTVRFRSR